MRCCQDCLYFVKATAPERGAADGACHRYPPLTTGFPGVYFTEWCGAFVPATPTPPTEREAAAAGGPGPRQE
jgi:hypothetical protein